MATQNARLDFRLTPQVKELIQQAADITGQSVTDFAVTALTEKARQVVQQSSMTVLSNCDRDRFLALLDADDEPNEALKKAAQRYKRRNA